MCLEIEPNTWAEAGEFFARSVFGVLISYLLVNKVREWCVPLDKKKITALEEEIEREIQRVEARKPNENAALNSIIDHYKASQTAAKTVSKVETWWYNGILWGSYTLLLACLAWDIYLLGSGAYKEYWWLPLCLPAPIPVARLLSWWRNKTADKAMEEKRKEYLAKKERYQKAYEVSKDEITPTKALKNYWDNASQMPHRPPFPEGPAHL